MQLEHINMTVPDPHATAQVLVSLFDWKIRWEGPAISAGYTVHVGTDTGYLALYSPGTDLKPPQDTYSQHSGLNHIGLVVDDLDAMETRVKAAGYTPHNHGDYEPGRRFYFDGPDGVEYELVSYAS